MAKTLDQILGYRNLTGIISAPVGGLPMVWDPRFMGQSVRVPVEGDTAEWIVVDGSRQNARVTPYGAPSKSTDSRNLGKRTAKCLHSFENMSHRMSVLTALKQVDSPDVQRRGEAEIDRQTVEFKRRFENLRVSALNSIFRHGLIYTDRSGNVLPTSSGATLTVDFQIPANNKNQLNGIISASWATAGTSILQHLINLSKAAVQAGNPPLVQAYHGSAIPRYFANNTEIKELLKTDRNLAAALGQGQIPTGFGIPEMVWKPLWNAYFVDADGTVREWFPEDFIVFCPAPDRSWYELQEGSFEVPTSIDIQTNALAAARSTEHVYGMFSYAKLGHDPVAIQQYAGDTFLPVIKNPSAVYLADVVP